MKKKLNSLLLLFFICYLCGGFCSASGVVSTALEAEDILSRVKATLNSKLNMNFKLPVVIEVLTAEKLDGLTQSPYKGAEIGLYSLKNWVHRIYVLKDLNSDICSGVTAHELTHAWQEENCPEQSEALKEGLAIWVEYKALCWNEAYYHANILNTYITGPVYGSGYRFIQKLEDKYGESNVLNAVKQLKDIPENY